jgi:hypothetical protein
MSGASGLPKKLSFKDRLRGITSRSRASSSSPGTSSILISASSSPSPAGLVAANSPSASIAPSSSQQAISNPSSDPSSNQNLLDEALKQVSDRDRATLRQFIPSTSRDIDSAVEQALAAAEGKQGQCLEKRWRVTFAGREFVLKEEADKVIRWLNRVKDVGDVIVNVDPVHAGLPWAGIRLLLEVRDSSKPKAVQPDVSMDRLPYLRRTK